MSIRSNDQSLYRKIEKYAVEDIIAGEYELLTGEMVSSTDYESRINDIESDVNEIIQLIKEYQTAEALEKLEILSARVY